MTGRQGDATSNPNSAATLSDAPAPTAADSSGELVVVEEIEQDEPPEDLEDPGAFGFKSDAEHLHRFKLAAVLITITTVLGGALLAQAVWGTDAQWARVERVGTLVLVPFQTLVAGAVGYYFGKK